MVQIFGELALIHSVPRASSILTSKDTHLATLDKDDFNRILKEKETERNNK